MSVASFKLLQDYEEYIEEQWDKYAEAFKRYLDKELYKVGMVKNKHI